MLRDLATVLTELHDGLVGATARRWQNRGIQLTSVEMLLPMDVVPIFADGGLSLLADVARSPADANWQQASSGFRVSWQSLPTAAFDGLPETAP